MNGETLLSKFTSEIFFILLKVAQYEALSLEHLIYGPLFLFILPLHISISMEIQLLFGITSFP
jgi:hypothetical protein